MARSSLGTYIELSRGVRMPQDMAAQVWRLDTGDFGMFDEHMPHRRRRSEGAERHLHMDEHMSRGGRMRRASVPEVSGQNLAYRGSNGNTKLTPVFGRDICSVLAFLSMSCNCKPITSPAPRS